MTPTFDALAAHGDAHAIFPTRDALILFSCTSVGGAAPSTHDVLARARSAHETLAYTGFAEATVDAVDVARAVLSKHLDTPLALMDVDLCLHRERGDTHHVWRAAVVAWGNSGKPKFMLECSHALPAEALLGLLQNAQGQRCAAA